MSGLFIWFGKQLAESMSSQDWTKLKFSKKEGTKQRVQSMP